MTVDSLDKAFDVMIRAPHDNQQHCENGALGSQPWDPQPCLQYPPSAQDSSIRRAKCSRAPQDVKSPSAKHCTPPCFFCPQLRIHGASSIAYIRTAVYDQKSPHRSLQRLVRQHLFQNVHEAERTIGQAGKFMAKSRVLHSHSLQTAPLRTAANKAALSTDLLCTVTG